MFEVGRGDTGDDVSRLEARRLRLSSVRKSIHDTRQLVTRIATAAYSELISPKERRKMKRAASNKGCCGLWNCWATPKFKPTDVIFGQATLSASTAVPVAPCRASLRLSPLILGPPHVQSEIGVIMHLPPARLPSMRQAIAASFFLLAITPAADTAQH